MRLALKLHPDSVCSAVTAIDVDVSQPHVCGLALTYVVTGTIRGLVIPPVTAAERTDGLWQHTCFEAFVTADPRVTYYEFNFAPSTQWAAYRFNGYRSAVNAPGGIAAPRIDAQSKSESFTLRAELDLDRASDLPRDKGWRLGLSAVIEETSGRKSYWALAHPPGKPDFHHPDCFMLELPPAWRP